MNDRELRAELAALEKLSTGQLQEKYRELFGDESRCRHRQWLLRRCAWRIQAVAEGSLSERARRRAMAIANDADVRFIPPSGAVPEPLNRREVYSTELKPDRRLPMPGTCMTRVFKGRVHEVLVQPNGFEYEGQFYKSLSAVAHAITGSHWNGYYFFKKSLVDTPRRRPR